LVKCDLWKIREKISFHKTTLSMPSIEPHLVPDEYYSASDIDRLFAALEKRIVPREILLIEDALVALNCTRSTLDRMVKKGLPYHTVPGLGGKMFLRSELIAYVKGC
jgi:hypothetical protein